MFLLNRQVFTKTFFEGLLRLSSGDSIVINPTPFDAALITDRGC